MARYLILIYGDEERWNALSPAEGQQIMEAHGAFQARAGTAILAAGRLEPTSTATTLRAGEGDAPSITDGPFLETKEALGGFYLIDVSDLDRAIELASGLAEVHQDHSGVQVHPVVD